MFRKHETSIAWKAGLLAVLVHVFLVGILLFSFKWKAAHIVVSVSEVELWDELPSKSQVMPKPKLPKVEPKPEPPEPEVEEEPEPEPKVEPEPEPEVPKVDIELENKKKKEAEKKRLEEAKKKAQEQKKKLALEKKKKAEQKRKEELVKLQKALLEDELDPNRKANEEALKKLQKDSLDELGSENKKRAGAASQGIVDEFISKIQAKVRSHVNKTLCADGSLEPQFKISLLPNGEFSGRPTLTKSSGNAVCDDAVERAIIKSEPFPLPKDPDALARFRDLNLKFKPNVD
jgi:colicin import membrane protein